MTEQASAADIRMTLCPRCGAPVTSPATGGQFQCAYCKTVGTVAARDDRPGGSPLAPDQEKARIERLRVQQQQGNDGDPYDVNKVLSDVAHLLKVPPGEFKEAWQQAWNQAVAMLNASPSDPINQRRVFWLTSMLNSSGNPNRGRDEAEWMWRRAVIETALDLLPDPGHRQILRGPLFGKALRSGDLASAERWIAGSDPAPAYLTLDSDYRNSHAMLETARGNWGRVVALLGERSDEFPVAQALACAGAFYRAHALEELGKPAPALEAYSQAVQLAGPNLEAFMKMGEWCHLCQKLRARAPANGAAPAVAPAAATGAPAPTGIAPFTGSVQPAAGGAMVASAPVGAMSPARPGSKRTLAIVLALAGVIVVGVVVAVVYSMHSAAPPAATHSAPRPEPPKHSKH
jgi:hypothetical protein